MTEAGKNSRLVAVGSSAGGIGAPSELVSTLAEGLSAPVVLAQRLDPERGRGLQEIQPSFEMRFAVAQDDVSPLFFEVKGRSVEGGPVEGGDAGGGCS